MNEKCSKVRNGGSSDVLRSVEEGGNIQHYALLHILLHTCTLLCRGIADLNLSGQEFLDEDIPT